MGLFPDRGEVGVREGKINQSPKGKMWSAVPLPCSDDFMCQPLKLAGQRTQRGQSPVEQRENLCARLSVRLSAFVRQAWARL